LLLVPIALARPTLTPLWFLPVCLWVTPHPESLGVVWQIALVLWVAVAIGAASVADRHRGLKALAVRPEPVL